MYFAVLTLHRLSWPCHVWVTIRVSPCNAVRFLCPYHSNVSQLVGPPAGGALFKRFGIRGPCIFGIVVISVDLIGRLLLIERREALALGFDPAAMMTAFVVDGLKSGGGDRGPAQQLKKSRAEDEDGS